MTWHDDIISFVFEFMKFSSIWQKKQQKFTIQHSSKHFCEYTKSNYIIQYTWFKKIFYFLFLNDLSLILDKVCSGNYLNSKHFFHKKNYCVFSVTLIFIFFAFIKCFLHFFFVYWHSLNTCICYGLNDHISFLFYWTNSYLLIF